MFIYKENPIELTDKFLKIMRRFWKAVRYEINLKKFFYTRNNHVENKIESKILTRKKTKYVGITAVVV